MKGLICGKVARVLNSREVAISVGKSDGVEVGMQFDILDAKMQDIVDPDTQEVIGSLNRPKVRVRVGYVEEQLSVARTFRTERINVGGDGIDYDVFRSVLLRTAPPKWVDRAETLKTTEETWEDLDEKDSFVKTGDPVRQVPAGMESDDTVVRRGLS